MVNAAKIRELVENVVTQALDAHILSLRDEIVDTVVQQLQPVLAAPPETPANAALKTALASIHEAVTQTDILKALLDNAALFCGRAALFVMRGSTAMGWQARGFQNNDGIRILSIDTSAGLAAFAIQQRTAVIGPTAQFDPRFVAGFGVPPDGQCLLLPLFIREKVAALVYADAGAEGDASREVDSATLELLVRAAGLWVELLALRKSAGISTPVPERAPASPPVMPAASAPHAFDRAPAPQPAPAGVPHPDADRERSERAAEGWGSSGQPAPHPEPEQREPERRAISAQPAPEPPQSPPASPAVETEEQELHRKARRFAKLLVDEIKLYNQSKLAQGKQNRDLYDRLKEDIEKSRATYDKRYGQTSAAGADYFSQELIRGLADNNPALLGSNFSR
ncbi:MAG: hypothetical protein ACE14M_11725 [Terriglobales bacterium]